MYIHCTRREHENSALAVGSSLSGWTCIHLVAQCVEAHSKQTLLTLHISSPNPELAPVTTTVLPEKFFFGPRGRKAHPRKTTTRSVPIKTVTSIHPRKTAKTKSRYDPLCTCYGLHSDFKQELITFVISRNCILPRTRSPRNCND